MTRIDATPGGGLRRPAAPKVALASAEPARIGARVEVEPTRFYTRVAMVPASAPRLLVALTLVWSGEACDGSSTPRPGPDCQLVVDMARAAQACDPQLGELADALQREPDEIACRRASRRLLGPNPTAASEVRSALQPTIAPPVDTPLNEDERRRMTALALPAELVLIPDVEPAPGLAATAASLGDVPLEQDDEGRLRVRVAPGLHGLELRHAGTGALYCVELRACETAAVTVHGDRLARHPDVRSGPC